MEQGTKKKMHTMLVATELTTEDLLEIFIDLAKDLTNDRNRALESAKSWESSLDMYTRAWIREIRATRDGHHQIDSLVSQTRKMKEKADQWDRLHVLALSHSDPFWMVPEPKEVKDEAKDKAPNTVSDTTTL